jgi:hypothetical protein
MVNNSGKNQFSFSDFHHINSSTNSTACFDLSNIHQPLSRNHRINPIDSRDLYKDDFTIETTNERFVEELFSEIFL